MKPPVNYYGGKQRMLRHLVEMIPEHKIYTETFLGGGALFWAKEPSPAEVINDVNDDIANFYRVLQTDFSVLEDLISSTFHTRGLHGLAHYFLGDDSHTSTSAAVHRAWAFWTQANMSYSAKLFGGFAYCRGHKTSANIHNKRERFTIAYKQRLQNVCIECNDALQVITSRDTPDTFHYCDPPYFNSNCGHYAGYTQADYEKLLQTLANAKGKFLLSSYPSDLLETYRSQHGWNQKKFTKSLTAGTGNSAKKTEVLTWNY